MIAITGATGQLGHHVIEALLQRAPASQLAALVRNTTKAADLAARGIAVRQANYDEPAALEIALKGIEKLLLISSNEVGKRLAQHGNVITAARRAGVKEIVYTSLLHVDTSPLNLAGEHWQTEHAIKASGIPHVILRNGWYTENYTSSIPAAIANGALVGSAGDGRIASASRADYALAAAVILTEAHEANRVYELAGDEAYTLSDLAAEISRQTGRTIPYRNLPEEAYKTLLVKAGLPEWLGAALASWDVGASHGALFDASHELSQLIGRPTTPLAAEVARALKKS